MNTLNEEVISQFEKYIGYTRNRFSNKDWRLFNIFQSGYNVAKGEKMIKTKFNLKLLVDVDDNNKAGDYLNNWISDPAPFSQFKDQFIDAYYNSITLAHKGPRQKLKKEIFKIESKEFIID